MLQSNHHRLPSRAASTFALTLGGLGCCISLTACSGASAQEPAQSEELAAMTKLAREIQVEVAVLRGLDFNADVPVEIATLEGFRAYAAERMESVGNQTQREAQELGAKMLGLIPTEMDYWGETLEILGGQVGGYYDPERDTFSIMAGVTGALAQSVLSHELVHALDDQHFDLGGAMESRAEDTDRLTAYHAVVEGSAMVVQTVWTMQHIGDFSAADIAEMSDVTPQELFETAPYIWMPVLFSYLRGQCFLQRTESLLAAQTRKFDPADLDRAFREPPTSTEQILHPAKYWDPEQRDEPAVVRVTAPEGSVWQPVHSEVLGEFGLRLVAAAPDSIEVPDAANPMSFLSIEFTSDESDGWEGDCAQLFERDGASLLVLATVWETEIDRDEFAEAMDARRDALLTAAQALGRHRGTTLASVAAQPVGELEFQLVIGIGVGSPDLVGTGFEVVIER
ncbi:hypothetical protein [Engelhardtia mirabilis]|uniref:Lipoprotein n=1 Tax=Engelhardtia mirabilis TaxID=2528011 RepID=A0A518BIY8_9BACT|nr:hypothetical protein Pla133_20270 [Planctomycetes bacterium Pla133]QDV01279.1 hypothetical protein Pla86_20280 [Planctomycetes bacterium Pla86]